MNILINATAIRSSGALSILRQFVDNLFFFKGDDIYYIFISSQINLPDIQNVIYIKVDKISWLKRILWDEYGFRVWVRKHGIKPDLIVSFQNTGVNYSSRISQLIYYHQPLPLMDYKWNFFRRNERLFFLYREFYAFFVKRYLHINSHIVVQIPFIKEAFIQKFEFNPDQVSIIKPNVKNLNDNLIETMEFEGNDIHFIYPATPLLYKNHNCVVLALVEIGKCSPDLIKRIRIHFTFSKKNGTPELLKHIKNAGFEDNFIFEETMSFEKLLSFYKASHALLFPSYIETFGLPLIEAASFGLPILVTDLPYARDVISDYEGACFLKLNDAQEWAKAMVAVCTHPVRFTPHIPVQKNSWEEFFHLINKLKSR